MLLCLAVLCCLRPVYATSETDAKQQLDEIQAQKLKVNAQVKRLTEEKAAQLEELRNLETQYGEQANALNELKISIQAFETRLKALRTDIAATQQDLSKQHEQLAYTVKSAFIMEKSRRSGLDLLLKQHDPALTGRMLKYYDYIVKARARNLRAIQDDLQKLRALEQQNQSESQLLQIALNKKQRETERLYSLKQQRERLIGELEQDQAEKKHQLADLLHDERKLTALLASLPISDDNSEQGSHADSHVKRRNPDPPPEATQSKPQAEKPVSAKPDTPPAGKLFAELKGELPWPVQGAILERFGSKRFETTWDGTVIAAKEGAAIHAVAAGRVVYADWLRGYGLMIIVNHGKGYMSLYAFNQSLNKSVGDTVKAGDSVASVGRSGGRSQAALYFGIRQQGKAVDPEKWCRRLGKS
ncbi:murein hydrolase activator EnvC family protein [Methylomonas rhizoryzae]|uniref:murein hydrolase activator EnvC family protein n=1 Tax=Methylomonas rhizoryzae TaxID=2608981 RepID=UPI001681B0E0|nr:peptidoglycan DD-metalloendopeptidase family protein [Methylomonas rhizoryzae]